MAELGHSLCSRVRIRAKRPTSRPRQSCDRPDAIAKGDVTAKVDVIAKVGVIAKVDATAKVGVIAKVDATAKVGVIAKVDATAKVDVTEKRGCHPEDGDSGPKDRTTQKIAMLSKRSPPTYAVSSSTANEAAVPTLRKG